jgi:hypothetical protein
MNYGLNPEFLQKLGKSGFKSGHEFWRNPVGCLDIQCAIDFRYLFPGDKEWDEFQRSLGKERGFGIVLGIWSLTDFSRRFEKFCSQVRQSGILKRTIVLAYTFDNIEFPHSAQ